MTGTPCYDIVNILAMLAIGLFIGALLGASAINYVRSKEADKRWGAISENIVSIFSFTPQSFCHAGK